MEIEKIFIFGSAAQRAADHGAAKPPRDIDVGVAPTSGEGKALSEEECKALLQKGREAARAWAAEIGFPGGIPIDAHIMWAVPVPVGGVRHRRVVPLVGRTPEFREVTSLPALLRLAEDFPELARAKLEAQGRELWAIRRDAPGDWRAREGALRLFYEGRSEVCPPEMADSNYDGEGFTALTSALRHVPEGFLERLGGLGVFLAAVKAAGIPTEEGRTRLGDAFGITTNGERVSFALSPEGEWSVIPRWREPTTFGELRKLAYGE